MSLCIKNLTISDRSHTPLFNTVSFCIEPGQILTLMGPSGCGKSTLLSVVAGHLSPEFHFNGEITLNNNDLTDLPPEKRQVGILFQDDLLFPHLSVWENLALALPARFKDINRKQKALETLTQIELLHLADHAPSQISGGQRARISLMRMLLAEPAAILLDEPFSKLDKSLRMSFRSWVFSQIIERKIPTLMVTHDEDDIPDNNPCLTWPWSQDINHA